MPDFDQLVGEVEAQPRFTRDVHLVVDSQAWSQAQHLTYQLDQTMRAPSDDVTGTSPRELAEQLARLQDDHPERLFRFEARTATEWDDLTSAGTAETGPQFWCRLMAASCVVFLDEPCADDRPDPSVFERLRATFTPAQWATLVAEVKALNDHLFDLRPTRAATALLHGTRPNSTSATDS